MQRSTRTICISLGAAAAALVFSGLAHAGSAASADSEPAKIEISYADLDLSRTEHATELYTRIQRAAHSVCHVTDGPNARALMLERRCEAKAVDDAVQSVGNANLTSVYAAKAGKRSMLASSR